MGQWTRNAAGLTAMQARFVDEYLIDRNGGEAYRRAGYRASGNAATVNAGKLLRLPAIAAAVAAGEGARAERTAITQDRVLEELARIGFFDVRELYGEDGQMRPFRELPARVAAGIAGVKLVRQRVSSKAGVVVKEQVLEVKAWDKNRALETIATHLGMLTKKVEAKIDAVLGVDVDRIRHMSDADLATLAEKLRERAARLALTA